MSYTADTAYVTAADVVDADDLRIPEAQAYVATRFYPPLPAAYGHLAVAAVDLVNNGDDLPLLLPEGINPQPRGARTLDGGGTVVDPAVLVDVLRLHHLIDDREVCCDWCGDETAHETPRGHLCDHCATRRQCENDHGPHDPEHNNVYDAAEEYRLGDGDVAVLCDSCHHNAARAGAFD